MLKKLSQNHSKIFNSQISNASSFSKTIVLTTLAIGCLMTLGFVGWEQAQKAVLRQQVMNTKQRLKTDPVSGLVLAIQAAGRNQTRLPWEILPEVQSNLREAVQTSKESNRFEQPKPVSTATFAPSGQQVAAAGTDGNITLWSLQDTRTKILQGDGQAIGSIQFSPDGTAVFGNPIAEGTVQFWNLQADVQASPPSSAISVAAFSSDHQSVISGTANGRVQLWNRQGDWIANLYPQQVSSVTAVAWDGSSLVSGSADGNIRLWNAKGEVLGRLWAGAKVTSLNLSQGGQRIVSQDLNRQQAFIWDDQTHQWNQFLLGETATVRSATLSPNNKTIARGNLDGSIQLLPLHGQSPVRSLLGHQGAVQSVSFSADGRSLVSAGEDGTVRVWDVQDDVSQTKEVEQTQISDRQRWLEIACDRLQYHPVFRSPATSEARSAKAICQRLVWSAKRQTARPINSAMEAAQAIEQPASPEAKGQLPQTALYETAPIAAETRVVVKLGERRVYVYQNDQVKASYPIATGKTGWETPTGTFRVFEMLQNPAWTHPFTRERMEPGGNNPLGSRWIAFWSDRSNKIGFHGTPNRESVGQSVSHGCLRMYNEDVQALYDQVQLGTLVTVER